MPISLFRVDERLIHGQVVVGWGSQIHPQRYVVVDGELASSEWEQELYSLGVPPGTEALFVSPDRARDDLSEWVNSPLRTVVLTRDIGTMLELARGRLLEGETINLGGLHAQEGKEEVLPYLYLGGADRDLIKELVAEGAKVSARDLPGSPVVAAATLLD